MATFAQKVATPAKNRVSAENDDHFSAEKWPPFATTQGNPMEKTLSSTELSLSAREYLIRYQKIVLVGELNIIRMAELSKICNLLTKCEGM